MELPSIGLSQRLEGLNDADGEALVGETAQHTAGEIAQPAPRDSLTARETEPVEKPETGTKRGNRIGWWW
jgi:hypothetical protein